MRFDKTLNWDSPQRICLTAIAITILLVVIRLPGTLHAGQEVALNVDEIEMTLSVADRFLGIPSTSLAWPGGTLQLIALPALAIDYCLTARFHLSQQSFMAYMSNLYRDPWHSLILVRLVVVVFSSAGLAFLFLALSSMIGRTSGGICAAILATLPVVSPYAQMALGDALALGLVCMVLAVLILMRSHSALMLAGALMGLAVAAKLTFLIAVPLVLAMAVKDRPPVKALIVFLSFMSVGFIFGCPYLWVEPLRLIKAVVGNISRPGEKKGLLGSLHDLRKAVSLLPLLLCLPGLIELVKKRESMLIAGVCLSALLTIGLTARSHMVYDRYFLPLTLPIAFLLGFSLRWLEQTLSRKKYWLIAGALAVAVCGWNTLNYIHEVNLNYANNLPYLRLADELKESDGIVIIPPILLPYVAKYASPDSLLELSENCRLQIGKAPHAGVSAEVMQAFGRNLTEDEQAFSARMSAMANTAPKDGLNLKIWGDEALATRFGFLTEKDALELYSSGQAQALVLTANSEASAATNARAVGDYRLLTVTAK